MRLPRTAAAAIAALCFFAMPQVGLAALQSSSVVLGFGESYAAPDGSTCTHRGADVAIAAGSAVEAPVGGTVHFAGRVPGPHGGSVLAVSIETAQGIISLLPLEDTVVTSGEHVEAGDILGKVAAGGDPSTPGSHVHVGLRRGDVYLDPVAVLAAPAPAAESEPQVEAEPEAEVSPQPTAGPALTPPQVQVGGARQSGSAVMAAPEGVGAVSGNAVRAGSTEGMTSSEPMGSGVSLAPGGVATAVSPQIQAGERAGESWPSAGRSVTRDGVEAAMSTARAAATWLARGGAPGIAAIAAALMACLLLLGRSSLERRITANLPVSNRLGRLLQQLRAGDTLRGLTSCSGHAAFTVPGPFSPEEVTK